MPRSTGTRYVLDPKRLYHFPHNSAIYEEFEFMLRALDPNKTGQSVYTFQEICSILLCEEVKRNRFSLFHKKPYSIFTRKDPPDFKTLVEKLGKRKAKRLAEARRVAYRQFVKNPYSNYSDFVHVQYKPTKTWKQNWVEFVRDYADMGAYCGLLPAFFKNPFSSSDEDGYVVSNECRRFLAGSIKPEAILMGMKYANSSINLAMYPQFNIRVRPFYCALRILRDQEDHGIRAIQKKLLGAVVGCLRSEKEIDEAVKLLVKDFTQDSIASFGNGPSQDPEFEREGERFSLSLVSFLEKFKLVDVKSMGRSSFVFPTTRGRNLASNTTRNALFYNHLVDHVKSTPLLGHLLSRFHDCSNRGQSAINIERLARQLQPGVTRSVLEDALQMMCTYLDPCPILNITKTSLRLSGPEDQYSVTPACDFGSSDEAEFISSGSIAVGAAITPGISIVKVPVDTVNKLRRAALASVGQDYEDALTSALRDLKFGSVVPLGHVHAGKRYTDIVWEVPVVDRLTTSQRTLLVVIEAKSGNAVKQFDERIAMDDIVQTLKQKYSSVLPQISGIWIWVLDGKALPVAHSGHGGHRPGAKSFEEKMNEMLQLSTQANRLVVVSAMNVESFIEYYTYLYRISRNVTPPLSEVKAPNFWIWGPAFRPLNGYVFIYNDAYEMRRKLAMR